MTLNDIINSGLVKDDQPIILQQRFFENINTIRKGNWYQDDILDALDQEVYRLTYNAVSGTWYVILRDKGAGI